MQQILDRYKSGVQITNVTMQACSRRSRCKPPSTMP
jgi:hypothetical protein